MIRSGIIKIDGALDETQAKQSDIEIEVPLGITRDRSDMMKPGNFAVHLDDDVFCLDSATRFRMKSDHSNDSEQDGSNEDDELCEFERRFRLHWSHSMQGRDFQERLHNQDEEIKIETHHGADDIGPAPGASESFRIPRINCNRQHRHGDDSENDRWCNTVKRKEESGRSGQDGGD